MQLDERSEKRLEGVNAALVNVVRRAARITTVEFVVTEGLRTKERQAQLVAKGASRTMDSKHITGRAVDLAAVVDGEVRWDWPLYHKLADAMKAAAKECGVKIVCGADWKRFPDGPHFELA
jgi:peptidoglycan LD-endopeptidase CwlK